MKNILKIVCLAAVSAAPLLAQTVNPCGETANLSLTASGVQTYTANSNGNKPLGGSGDLAYGYEMWTAGGNNNKLIWFGPNQGGGMAFRTEYNEPNDYLGRIGFYWGKSGKKWDQYKNIYADFNYTRSANGTGGGYSYIGIYGWTWDPMMEWYIIDDWYGSGQLGPATVCENKCASLGTLTIDGGTYYVYTFTRPQGSGSIADGNPAFPQIFSIRQGMGTSRRQCGTYSVTEHFKEWAKISSISSFIGKNLYEAKFLAEAGGGTGWLELSYLKMTQEDPRGSASSVSSSSRASSSSISSTPVACSYQTSFCGGMAFANVSSNTTSIPSTGTCVYIGDFDIIQPALSSTVSINGIENTCGADWDDCPYNERPSAVDGGYYVYVKTGTINGYENNGWKDIVAKAKPNCANAGTQSSSSRAVSSSSRANSSSSRAVVNSSSSGGTTPILDSEFSILNSQFSIQYYTLKGNPLGSAKPDKPGIYILREGQSIKKIVVR